IGCDNLPSVDLNWSAASFGGGDVVCDRVFVFFHARGVSVFVGFVQCFGAGRLIGIKHGDRFSTGMLIQVSICLERRAHAGGLGIKQQVILCSTGLLTQVWVLGTG